MLHVFPPSDVTLYTEEQHVLDWAGKSLVIFAELKPYYGSYGG